MFESDFSKTILAIAIIAQLSFDVFCAISIPWLIQENQNSYDNDVILSNSITTFAEYTNLTSKIIPIMSRSQNQLIESVFMDDPEFFDGMADFRYQMSERTKTGGLERFYNCTPDHNISRYVINEPIVTIPDAKHPQLLGYAINTYDRSRNFELVERLEIYNNKVTYELIDCAKIIYMPETEQFQIIYFNIQDDLNVTGGSE